MAGDGPTEPDGSALDRWASRAVVPARPEKTSIGPGLGRQSGTTPDTTRHETVVVPDRAGPLSAGLFRASAELGPGGPLEIYSLRHDKWAGCTRGVFSLILLLPLFLYS
jgi:hypothetical protein